MAQKSWKYDVNKSTQQKEKNTSTPWAVRLSWLENAYSRQLSGGRFDP